LNVRNEWHPDNNSTPITNPNDNIGKKAYILITDNVNIRKGPGVEYGILGSAKEGDKFLYWEKQFEDGWYLIDYNKQLAAVSNKYSKLIEGG
jgi:uncharacterized protein YgiM (DUF1202 family)